MVPGLQLVIIIFLLIYQLSVFVYKMSEDYETCTCPQFPRAQGDVFNGLVLSVQRCSVHRDTKQTIISSKKALKPSWSPTVEVGGKANRRERSRVWEVTEGRVEGESRQKMMAVVGVWICGASPFLNGPQQCFCARGSFISIGRKVLSDSSGGSLLFRGARGSTLVAFHLKPSNTNQ